MLGVREPKAWVVAVIQGDVWTATEKIESSARSARYSMPPGLPLASHCAVIDVSPTAVARYHIALGDTARAHELLERALEEHAGSLVFIGEYPLLDALRADARFQELERHIGTPAAREVAVSAVSN